MGGKGRQAALGRERAALPAPCPGSCSSAPASRIAVAAAPAPALAAVGLRRSEKLYRVLSWRVQGDRGDLRRAGTRVPAVGSEGA